MATTFKDMQDDVLNECHDLQTRIDFSLTRIKRAINRGYHNFVKDTDCIFDSFNFTTVANQQYYDSSDVANFAYCYKISTVKYVEESTEFGKTLIPYPGGYNALPRNKSYGEPSYYYIRGMTSNNLRKIGTYPIMDSAGETLQVEGCRYPTSELSEASDEPEIDEEYRDAIIYYAVYRIYHSYFNLNKDWRSKSIEYKQLYKEIVDEFRYNNFIDDLEGLQVQDAFPEY